MAIFSRRPHVDPADVERLRKALDDVRGALHGLRDEHHALQSEHRELRAAHTELSNAHNHLSRAHSGLRREHQELLDSVNAPAAEPTMARAEAERRIAHNERLVAEFGHRLELLKGHIASVGNELTNQFSELSADIERLAEQSSATQTLPSDEDWDAIRTAQERLAGEQVRYQIAFRKELAALADRVLRAPAQPPTGRPRRSKRPTNG